MNSSLQIGVLNYKMGNLASIVNSLKYVGYTPKIISSSSEIDSSDCLILPGVGAFPTAMNNLEEMLVIDSIKEFANRGRLLIGICLGMQLLFSESFEYGKTNGLNLIPGQVIQFDKKLGLRVPHMGWNEIYSRTAEFKENEGNYYFVHSYYCVPSMQEHVLFKSFYGIEFCSGVHNGMNIYGLQFHPEKSQKLGLQLINDILSKC